MLLRPPLKSRLALYTPTTYVMLACLAAETTAYRPCVFIWFATREYFFACFWQSSYRYVGLAKWIRFSMLMFFSIRRWPSYLRV